MPTVRVLYFGAARERAQTAEERVELPSGARVFDLCQLLALRHPLLAAIQKHLRVAVNHEFAEPQTVLPDEAEVAMIPPVAGGSGNGLFAVVDRPLELSEVVRAVGGERYGGLVTFSGVVRSESHGRKVVRLEYEAYVPMAEKKLADIGSEISSKWPNTRVAVVHRVGVLTPGQVAVVIAVAAPHRAEAFRGCEYCIDRLKQDVPIWKREHFEDGQVWVGLGP